MTAKLRAGLPQRQDVYNRALEELSRVEVHLGQFKHREKNLPLVRGYRSGKIKMARVVHTEGEGIAVVTVKPHKQSEQPRRLLSGDKRTLKRKLLEQCQLPDPVIGVKGS